MKANSRTFAIAAFVCGALALAIGAVAAFGPGLLYTNSLRCIMFFPYAVSGLRAGSPVLFRGVPVGSVKEISIQADPALLNFHIPVVVELLGGKVRLDAISLPEGSETLYEARKESPEALLRQLIQKGLRAQLVTQSFVTGQQAISLDLMPDTPQRLVGNTNLLEIPTVPSNFEKFARTIRQLPLQDIVPRLIKAISDAERLLNEPSMTGMPKRVDEVLDSSDATVTEIRDMVGPLANKLDRSLGDYTELAKHLQERADNLAGDAARTFAAMDAKLAETRAALGNFQQIVNSKSSTVADLNRSLNEVAKAARAIRAMTDYLELHPEALIRGKGIPGR